MNTLIQARALSEDYSADRLWESAGTAAGTKMLTGLNAQYGGPDAQDLTAVGNTPFFAANDGTHGDQLWESDGTATGTVMVTNSSAHYGGFYPSNLTAVNGTLYFTAYDANVRSHLDGSQGLLAGPAGDAGSAAVATSSANGRRAPE
jgi:ELWxxDGT repeat protein